MDIIQNLGTLAFASRLKRLADKLQRDASRIYKDRGIDFEARWFPVMYALSKHKAMAITELASKLNMTHPAINQISTAMQKKGIINSQRGLQDERQRFISLSDEGIELLEKLKPIWYDIAAATDELIIQSDKNFLKKLAKIENQLYKKSVYDRISLKYKDSDYKRIKIVDYKPSYKKYFKQLNLPWLRKHFKVEKYDERILSDPQRYIIKPGGIILFAKMDNKVIGTIAAHPVHPGVYEICKLGVDEKYRGHQAGRKLVEVMIKRLKSLKAKKIVLATSPKLPAANNLYESLGFEPADDEYGLLSVVRRKSFCMELKS